MPRKMTRPHHIILMEDRNQRCPAQHDATVPVAGKAESLGIDLDHGRVTDDLTTQLDRQVARLVIADEKVEIDSGVSFREDAREGFSEMPSTVVGRNGHGKSRDRRQGSLPKGIE